MLLSYFLLPCRKGSNNKDLGTVSDVWTLILCARSPLPHRSDIYYSCRLEKCELGAFDRAFSGITDGIHGVGAEALTRTTYNVGLDEFYSLFRYFSLESSSGLT